MMNSSKLSGPSVSHRTPGGRHSLRARRWFVSPHSCPIAAELTTSSATLTRNLNHTLTQEGACAEEIMIKSKIKTITTRTRCLIRWQRTPALSLSFGERVNRAPLEETFHGLPLSSAHGSLFPLPEGEGQGERIGREAQPPCR